MKIYISGGCKNGKSYYAQRLAKEQQTQAEPLYYIATMRSTGTEDDERIKRHIAEREGWGFTTVEQPLNIEELLQKCDTNGSFLLDSVTALLANEMFSQDGRVDYNAAKRVTGGLLQLLRGIPRIVMVSDYIFSDAAVYDPLTECYRQSLAELDRAAARNCDGVLEVTFSCVTAHKWNTGEKSLFSLPELIVKE